MERKSDAHGNGWFQQPGRRGCVNDEQPESAAVRVEIGEAADVFVARRRAREFATRQGFALAPADALATAVSEVARNIVVHALRGEVAFGVARSRRRTGVRVVARDRGPGIADPARALQDGYSTSGGLGFGLSGARRLVDLFRIESAVGGGTVITMTKWLP